MTIHHGRLTAMWTRNNRPIQPIDKVAHDLDTLHSDVCDSICEIRKENGEQYPGSSLYDLLSGLSTHLQRDYGFSNKLMSRAFADIHNTLDNLMKERSADGIKGHPEREPVLEDHEQILWDKGILGEDTPDKLRKTVFFLIGVRFGLRGIKEQHSLQRYPDSQINIIQVDGKDALVYREFQSKTNQGGIKDRGKPPPKVRYAFCSGFRPRCFVELYRKYLFLGPNGTHSWRKFYLQTDPQWTPGSDYWYLHKPVGKNTLAKYIETMMKEAGIPRIFKNHSLRKGTCTHLFHKGVDPDLIKEQTGHKSDAIMIYKKSDIALKKQVSDMLSVLPKEMNQIRERETKMLSDEGKRNEKFDVKPALVEVQGQLEKQGNDHDHEEKIDVKPASVEVQGQLEKQGNDHDHDNKIEVKR